MGRSSWKRARAWVMIGVATLLVGVLVVPAVATSSWQARWIGVKRIQMNQDFMFGDQHQIRAFIPTGSTSRGCLVTLAESDFAQPGQTIYCGNRVRDGVPGVFVAVMSMQEFPPVFAMELSVYQAGATYGKPVPCADLTDVC